MKTLNVCPCTLSEGYHSYSPEALQRLFGGEKLSPQLSFSLKTPKGKGIPASLSISGYQEKYGLRLQGNTLVLNEQEGRSTHILKPISEMPKNEAFAPANEHLTMQIAQQVFGIETAESALVFFADGTPAYLTKRFDVAPNGERYAVEDFASLLGKTPQTHGTDYKYTGAYSDLFAVLKQYATDWQTESQKLFALILFNYLFSNGDAHLKNFSHITRPQGQFTLSPAYDLLNTALHIEDPPFALKDGLYPAAQGKLIQQFYQLGEKVGLAATTVSALISKLTSQSEQVLSLVARSFLSERLKRSYIQYYQRRLKKLAN